MLYFVIFIAGWERLCDFPPSVRSHQVVPRECAVAVYSPGLGGLRLDWGQSLRSPGGGERSRQRQSVSEYGGIGIWRRLTTWPGDHWWQVGSRDHGGVHIRQPRHSGRGRGWVQDFLWYFKIKMLRGKSGRSYKDPLKKILLRDTKAISPIEKVYSWDLFDRAFTFFSWVDDGLHNLLRGHIPYHRCGPDHPVRHLLQTAPEEEAQFRHQEG